MRKVAITAALVLASCSGRGEIIPNPSPAPDSPATTEGINTTALVAAPATTEAPTTTTEPPTTTTRVRAATTTTEYLREEATSRSGSGQLASIRACESGNNYSTDTGNGYYGAYQFSMSTWRSVGGSGNPAHASPAEQDMRAQMMIDAGRRGEWPNC